MIYRYLILAESGTGEIIGFGQTTFFQNIPENSLLLPDEANPSVESIHGKYVSFGGVLVRPTVPEPDGWVYDLTQLPAGTTVTVTNEDGDQLVVTDLSGSLNLLDPGTYWFDIEPPFPYMPLQKEITNA